MILPVPMAMEKLGTKMIILDPLLEIVHIKVLTLVDIGKLHALKNRTSSFQILVIIGIVFARSNLTFILSDLHYSADIAEFLANFLRRIVKKIGQKLILGHYFISNISDDFYVLHFCFCNIF